MKDYYGILGVEKTASADEIKKAYRKLANTHHPDKGGDENKFKEISEAYDVLSDTNKKAQYDMGGQGNMGGFNINDIFNGGFGSIFGDFNGFGSNGVRKGQDLRINITVSLKEIIEGSTKKVRYKRQAKCEPCDGRGGENVISCIHCGGKGIVTIVQPTPFGRMQHNTVCNHCTGTGKTIKDKCKTCHGSGAVDKKEVYEFTLPPGVFGGMQITQHGMGSFVRDGITGDLKIFINETPDPNFKREDANLTTDIWVSIPDAILGHVYNLNTPHGAINITIQPGCESGRIFKVSGRGVPIINGAGTIVGNGDLYVKVNVKIPKSLTHEEKEIFIKLKDSKNIKVN